VGVVIIGTGITKFGELWAKNWEELVLECCFESIEKSNLEPKDIDFCYVGNMGLSRFEGQDHIAPRITEILNISKVIRTEAACASGSVALKLGVNELEASLKRNKVGLIVGFEKMTDRITGHTTTILAGASHLDTEVISGATFPGLYAIMANRYIYETGADENDLHAVAIKNHKNAMLNEKAMFRREINLQDFKSDVASPLKLLDCSPVSDGAASLIITTEEYAKELGVEYVKLEGIEVRTSTEILCLESAGLAKRGEGYKLVRSLKPYEEINKRKAPIPYLVDNKEIYVNTSGGLKAKGHPVGATGVAQIVEIVNQLLGRCGNRNIYPKIGAAVNVGGTGGSATFSILR